MIGLNLKDNFIAVSCVEVGRQVTDDKVMNDHHKNPPRFQSNHQQHCKAFKFL